MSISRGSQAAARPTAWIRGKFCFSSWPPQITSTRAPSDVIQIGYFKISGGKRVFRMAPLHHHFELKGWGEVTIVIRFWLIAALCVALAVALFYGEWLATV